MADDPQCVYSQPRVHCTLVGAYLVPDSCIMDSAV